MSHSVYLLKRYAAKSAHGQTRQGWKRHASVPGVSGAHAGRQRRQESGTPIDIYHEDHRVLRYENTTKAAASIDQDLTLVTMEGGPHNVARTHPEVIDAALLEFVKG
ncbi:alpha/beta hydrolase [Streptomyces sp. Ncost-T10-10d]|uniref:alpha/beta hydrolase n=1 Tax=Streptomyces sp. Ncost-T10-10d TaxID=1839774 RepID=UPI00114CEDA3|nr:alpha/beta hydrolase [Streptomyces sp. Ncost-T10-10d]